MITQCSCCQMDTAGNHELNCPMNPYYVAPPVIISGGYVPPDLIAKIAALESQVTRLRELCGDMYKHGETEYTTMGERNRAVDSIMQRLRDEGVVTE